MLHYLIALATTHTCNAPPRGQTSDVCAALTLTARLLFKALEWLRLIPLPSSRPTSNPILGQPSAGPWAGLSGGKP